MVGMTIFGPNYDVFFFSGEVQKIVKMNFDALRRLTDLTYRELDFLEGICFQGTQMVEGHLFYNGENTGKYPETTFHFRGQRYKMRKTQLSLFLKLKRNGEDLGEEEGKTSHLCHKKSCLRQDHLTSESTVQNNNRDECARQRQCRGHRESPNCIF